MTRDQTMDRRRLYGEIEPDAGERLKLSDIHELHDEESGNPDGKPVVFLHGGPGGASMGLSNDVGMEAVAAV